MTYRTFAWMCLIVAMLCSAPPAPAGDRGEALPRAKAVVGYSQSLIPAYMRREAAQLTRGFVQAIIDHAGENFDVDVTTLQGSDPVALRKQLKRGVADIIALATDEYLAVADTALIEPQITGMRKGSVTTHCVLLVRRTDTLVEIEDLRGGKVLVDRSGRGNLARIWLDTLTMGRGLPPADVFFSAVKCVGKPGHAVLPLFFKQVDACVVSREGYETMAELNPQVGRQVAVLVESPPLLIAVVSFRPSYPKDLQERGKRLLFGLDRSDPHSDQLFVLFGIDRLVPWKPAYIETTRALVERYHALHRSYGKLTP